jgi:hypothetical protein
MTKAAVRTRTRVPGPSRVAVGSTRSAPADSRVLTSRPLAVLRLPSVAIDNQVGPLALRFGWCASTQWPAAENSCSGTLVNGWRQTPVDWRTQRAAAARHCRRSSAAGCSRQRVPRPRWAPTPYPTSAGARSRARCCRKPVPPGRLAPVALSPAGPGCARRALHCARRCCPGPAGCRRGSGGWRCRATAWQPAVPASRPPAAGRRCPAVRSAGRRRRPAGRPAGRRRPAAPRRCCQRPAQRR